jgi:hypothetical protein
MSFDDPEQDPPKYRWRNYVRAQLPVPGLWLTGFKGSSGDVGVFPTGNRPTQEQVMDNLGEDILSELFGRLLPHARQGTAFPISG